MRPTPFSRRTSWPSHPNRLTLAAARRIEGGLPLLDLTVSNPTTAKLGHDPSQLASLASPLGLTYAPEALGLASAREAVAAHFGDRGVKVDPSRVMLTASSSEAYSFLFHALADEGDEVLAPTPSYPLFQFLADLAGVHLRPYPLGYDGAWHLDIGALRGAIGPRTRAVVVVTPNNPTGSYLKQAELAALAELCEEHGLAIVSDEVFADYPLRPDPTRAPSVAHQDRCLSFALGGLSKAAALPQLKLGWTVASGPRALVDEAMARLSLVADTFLSVSTPVQLALPELLAQSRPVADRIRARTSRNLAHLARSLPADSPASLLDVEGGWYATLRVPRTRSEEDWAVDLVSRGVLVHPGHFFDFDREAFLVVSLLTPEPDFDEGVRILMEAVGELAAVPRGAAQGSVGKARVDAAVPRGARLWFGRQGPRKAGLSAPLVARRCYRAAMGAR